MSLLINVFGAPGSGKSTFAAGLFYHLKCDRLNVELASEFAKELTFNEDWNGLKDQIGIFAEQRRRIERLLPHCDVTVTDCPILLGASYYPELFPDSFRDLLLWSFNQHESLNLFLERAQPYSTHGRRQTEGESDKIAEEMKAFLDKSGVTYTVLHGNHDGLQTALGMIRKIVSPKDLLEELTGEICNHCETEQLCEFCEMGCDCTCNDVGC